VHADSKPAARLSESSRRLPEEKAKVGARRNQTGCGWLPPTGLPFGLGFASAPSSAAKRLDTDSVETLLACSQQEGALLEILVPSCGQRPRSSLHSHTLPLVISRLASARVLQRPTSSRSCQAGMPSSSRLGSISVVVRRVSSRRHGIGSAFGPNKLSDAPLLCTQPPCVVDHSASKASTCLAKRRFSPSVGRDA